jgi:choline dehydrogenase-like flavoprotein
MQVIKSPKVYDVCIVGSGAGGGTTAKVLTEAGADVVMLEGGPMWDSAKDSAMFAWNYASMNRGYGGDKKPFGEHDGCIGGWDIDGEPYTVGTGAWRWFRGRLLGGRTNHWGRISLRFGPDDFRGKSIDGFGDDWPITYDDMKPYYDKLDQFVGIFGSNHAAQTGLHNEPDGFFLPPPKPRHYELSIKQACDKLKIPVVPSRLSILTKAHNGRAACHYCGQCGRGCATHSNFSSTSVMLPPALKTGKLTIIANAMAREVLTNAEGLATGVSYIDTQKNTEYQVRAKAVVLSASCCESARLLLNSKSTRHPGGLANSSGVVGKYLTDSTGLNVSGFVPKLMDVPRYNADGVGGMHVYVPWWGYNKKLGFARGYHIELGGGFGMPSYGFGGGIHNYPQSRGGGYGKELKDEYRRYYGARRAGGPRGLPLRDRSERGRSLGHPGAALPPHVERPGAPAGQAHAGDLPQHHRRDGRHRDLPDADQGAGLRPGGRRPDHPRGRCDADGQRSEDVGAEQERPSPRRQERVRL